MSEEASEPETEDTMVAALLREREGLVQRGLKDRVAQVDEQLKLRGYKPPRGGRAGRPAEKKADDTQAPAEAKTEAEQRAEPPKGRTQKPSETA
ncbi:hypothetical protein [Streptomyces sp. NPDC096311]|uniref:hypothetical protein n=1 Tax=Streptomyces sp. NPDC096311 TaxID=3366083 RepID=UPI0037F75FA1